MQSAYKYAYGKVVRTLLTE